MKKSIILSFVFIACFNHIALASVFSTQEQIYSRMDEQRVQADPRFHQQNAVIKKPEIGVYQNIQTTKLTRDELVKQPTLLVQALLSAVMSNNGENATFLLPLYQQLSLKQQIPVLTTWVTALSDKYHRRYSQSIRQYRQLVADYPGNQIIRFQLATALFENNEMEAAEDQFHKLQSENLPVEVNDVISKYLSVISSRDNWALRGGVTYLNDPNVNNAPEMGTRIGSWVAKKRERAEGFGFWGELSKKWSWGNGFFNEFRLNGDGKYYWNNKKYSEYTVRSSLGSGYQSAVQKFTILPFMEQMWYAGGNVNSESVKRYSKSSGATVEWQYWVSPDLQWSSQYEYGEQRYIARKHLNGNYHYIATNLIYFTDSKQYWLLGMNFNRTSTRDSDNSYIRRGIQIGWGQEWGMGLSSRLTLSYARKNYYAPMPIFQVTQRNKEYGAQLSLWHRAFHFGGITPRVTFAYNKVKSNHAFFTYDKKRLFLEFTKTF